ncbi:CPBP family glutamic-type intramembrane protease [Dyadobacter psychrotolerans]|uniref:CPBP family intramembrane metalloprotease n=1 Tax=Dyadobacter psychrotolerans TaxID=2541721 RepID=A0A4R5DL94_9BACT|nr:CPBP family intramembrane metalloprotease [Dyadobacter psychrotolerans]
MKTFATEIFSLLRHGVVINDQFKKSESIYKFLLLFVLIEIARMIFTIIIFYFLKPLNLVIRQKPFQDLIIENGMIYIIIMGCLLAPILEEVAWRLCLKYSSWNLTLMIGSLSFFGLGYILNTNVNLNENRLIILKVTITLIICSIHFLCLKKFKNIDLLLINFWFTYPKIIFYTSVLCFAFFHILNYRWSTMTLLLTPLLTLPQILAGITLSYARLKYGVILSIFLHSMSNFIGILIISNFSRQN